MDKSLPAKPWEVADVPYQPHDMGGVQPSPSGDPSTACTALRNLAMMGREHQEELWPARIEDKMGRDFPAELSPGKYP